MNLSMKWLSDYIKKDIPIKEFCAEMTMSGSKVEGYEEEGSQIKNVVVGKLLSVVPHENSDHLVVCQVDIGQDTPIQIVTGAPNVSAGDIVPVALVGAELPGGIKIKKGKLRGVESYGMLCSLGELGLTKHDFPYAIEDGIFLIQEECEIGQDIHSAIGLNDTSVEFEITPNRPDCLSVIGLAREAAVTFNTPLCVKEPAFNGIDEDITAQLKVNVENTKLCPRYAAGIVKNVKIQPSPRWMRERLRASGVRPINNLVDITNYVMLEYGQPMHAFDIKYIDNNHIIVRNAKDGETITTLDGVTRTLSSEMLVIADENKPVAVAGVMGGEYSGIMDDTTTVVFESAYFDGAQVRKTAKKLGMRTDASARYEKGLSPESCLRTLTRAFELVEMLGAGEPVKSYIDVDNSSINAPKIPFNPEWINKFLGTDIAESEMRKTLEALEIKVEEDCCIAPSFRMDLERPADIAEEVARIYGYNNIPSTFVKGVANAKLTKEQQFNQKIENTMVSLGGYGILTYSFISPKYFDKINLPEDSKLRETVTISNPLGEDTSVMRTTILPSMLEVLASNYKNRNSAVTLFEIGKEYIPTGKDTLPMELQRLAVGMYGDGIDFYDIKGVIDSLLKEIGVEGYTYIRPEELNAFEETCALHPGRSAVLLKNDTALGFIGEVHPYVQENYGLGVKTYVAKLNIPELIEIAQTEITYKPLPKYPATTRDLSLLCDDSLPVGKMESVIKEAVGKILEEITIFDVYKGSQIEEGKKSVSFSIRMRSHEGTLTDQQADSAIKKVLKELEKIGASLRV
ncbi:MAG: phenylalanine--tRNA ligase subunit beta [Ruminococcus sp.]|nr:phenylalanine--tRNA ligase subunit beta [Ruminococcus sp.]